ncbi:hypothetical protein NliqN6_1493 [Naganishia liquefaciens]|uniref:Glucosidase II subunit alpha n=1 Tax=Naganishia liquefaciens TaxID=104408 RepID=A0A8H3YEV0_9TREE|nr:hypothetical protein NliqN6_1493 [Naganishia liquefaciens]
MQEPRAWLWRWPLAFLLVLITVVSTTHAAKHGDFKTCSQSSFCRRLRSLSERAQASGFHSPYSLGDGYLSDAAQQGGASWTFSLDTELYPDIHFALTVDFLSKGDGIARLRVDEVGSKLPWKRYNEAAKWALVDPEPALTAVGNVKKVSSKGQTRFTYGVNSDLELIVDHAPFKVTFRRSGEDIMYINERNLFHMEHFRSKAETPAQVDGGDAAAVSEQQVFSATSGKKDTTWFEGEPDAELWEERFSKWTDSKPKGPEAFSVDISFPGVEHIFGLAEHASPLSLPSTDGGRYTEPYRLWNVDIFEYEHDSTMALYGAIPLVHAQNTKHSVGLLSLVASETLVDVVHAKSGVQTHWMSESGIMDLLILPGPDPASLFKQYAALTGTTDLPPQWSLGYHQCRWNYIDDTDVLEVQRRFDEEDIPLDVTWLDIEYAEEHRYFDWDKKHFPDPVKLQNEVGAKGRKMVAIVDPHIKRTDDFRIYKDAQDKNVITKKSDGKTNFEGWCWTGSSVWVDFFNPASWSWWKDMFSFNVWKDSTKFLFIWNDMNEPSVFDGPEISMPRDNVHHGGWEHRDVHNINGMMFHRATHDALVVREEPAKRSFVLSRSFFAGSQRYGAIWTGDNMGTWDHMAGETSMLLSLNICGMTFCGADVGGFFGNPSPEMLIRWYQAGAFMPFFRAHAHIDTKRREPYLYEDPYKSIMRDTIRLRYTMLPIWYTAFHEASRTGTPTMRPQYVVFPKDDKGFAVDDQYYVGGSGLLVKPVTAPSVDSSQVYLSDNQPYYNYFTHHFYPASDSVRNVTVPSPLESFPLLVQGGNILPIRARARRASTLMWRDPFTLVVALRRQGDAQGELYLDDGESFAYANGDYVWRGFRAVSERGQTVVSSFDKASSENGSALTRLGSWASQIADVHVEKLVILGLETKPTSVTVEGEAGDLAWVWEDGCAATDKAEGTASRLTIKAPGVRVLREWSIRIV